MGGRNNRRSSGKGMDNSGSRNNSRGRGGGGRGGGGRGRGRGGGGRGRGRGGVSLAIREGLFVDGGVLSDWQLDTPSPPQPFSRGGRRTSGGSKGGSFEGHRGRRVSEIMWRETTGGSNRTVNSLKIGNLDGGVSSGSKWVQKKGRARAYGYQYPSIELQGGSLQEPSTEVSGGDMGDSQDFSLRGSEETTIIAYEDEIPSSVSPLPCVTYDCSYDFIMGDSSHRGLGYEEDVVVGEASSEQMKLTEESKNDLSASDTPKDIREGSGSGCSLKMEKSLPKRLSSRNDPAFLSIGGIKLYTQDISHYEDDDEDNECSSEESLESEMSSGEESVQSSESDGSEDEFDSGSSVDDDVVADYLEGVGGCDTLLDGANWLVEEIPDDSDDSSSDDITDAMEKLGGIALQEASMEYGLQKNFHSSHKSVVSGRDYWSSAMDAYVSVKDPRALISKKGRVSQFPQSWPSKSQSKTLKNYPGAKKWVRKEAIAAKRRNRMMLRGVDLEQINTKLEQIVLDGVDMYSFQPMHPRDCSQIQRLAAIYRLRSSSQGSGKKRFVTVARSQHTSMPSSSDKVRLEKLIGLGDDADYPMVDVEPLRSGGGRKSTKGTPTGSNPRPQGITPGSRRKSSWSSANRSGGGETGIGRGKKKGPLTNLSVRFVSSGVMQSETTTDLVTPPVNREGKNVNKEVRRSLVHDTKEFGAFEVHTKGFGSKMMAKMGFVEGQGLGRDGGGMAAPIQVVQRPRSLGLGMNF
ncbi:hypothetical protein MLD38_006775 [Melastoma candidum]|uniref:Uncharacterized protein n=1 Tax=Melastoma candidum TaxID=119954 RepID=A0ACB9RXF9_9MYRT|nr:hypothetical protein MLD38_006775 [Melastoma candidum]